MGEFDDPRLAAAYDTLNGYAPGTQPDFYLGLARDLDARTVVEIGCGTGLVTTRFVRAGCTVIGLDPSGPMLEVARRRPGASGARWIHGSVTALDVRDADLAFMAGHVAQFFLTDECWHEALTTIHAALRPGGRLAFETRNPVARAWERWTPDRTRRTVRDPVLGEIETWTGVVDVRGDVVVTALHHRFAVTGDELTVETALRFRTAEEVDRALLAAGFVTEHRYGGWDRRPFTGHDDEIVVVARALGFDRPHGGIPRGDLRTVQTGAVMSQPRQQQNPPGHTAEMDPTPDHGEQSYRGTGRLAGKATVITGADSGIGRAVAIAFAREGADVLISYLSEEDDARETARWVEEAGRKAVLVPGDLVDPAHCRAVIDRAVQEFGRIDVLVLNAAFQMTYESVEEVPDDEWDRTVATNLNAFFHMTKAALPHMPEGSSIIGSSSVNSDSPSPNLFPYAMTKAGIANLCAGLAQLLGPRGIRVNSVAPGPIWTPLIPSTMPPEKVEKFGGDTPLGRAGQPAELAPVYVLLASDEASYVSGARVAVTGGRPVL